MARRLRVHFPGPLYHFISRAIKGKGYIKMIRLTEAARYFGRNPRTLSLAMKRLEEQIQRDSKQR